MVVYGNWFYIYYAAEGIDLRSDTVDLPHVAQVIETSEECQLRTTTLDERVLTKVWYKGYNEVPAKRVHMTNSLPSATTIIIGWYSG